MKRYTFILAAMLIAGPLYADGRKSYLEQIQVNDLNVRREGQMVNLSFLPDLSNLRVRTQDRLSLVPVLVSADGRHERALEPIVIYGRVRGVKLDRQLMRQADVQDYGVTVRRKGGHWEAPAYTASVPFEPWMRNATLNLREYVTGCAGCEKGDFVTTIDPHILPFVAPAYARATVAPREEGVKHRSVTFRGRFQFELDRHDVLLDYKGNRAKLDEMRARIDSVANDPTVTISAIEVQGYTSPEAPVEYNERLARNRATALEGYMKQQFPQIPADKWKVSWPNEDWTELRRQIEADRTLEGRDRVLHIIDTEPDLDRREWLIKILRPESIYRTIYERYYPYLRHNDYVVSFTVRNFSVEEGRRIILEKPLRLSAAEAYQVAMSYPEGSPERLRSMQIAAATFDRDEATLHNLAVELMSRGLHADALEALEGAPETGDLLNLRGAALVNLNRYAEAAKDFRRAAELGNADARTNLDELDGVR